MNYFGKKLLGGSINSAGISQQDCASIVFLFDSLNDTEFKEITFETNDDFTIRFSDNKEIYVQVKINLIDIKLANKLLDDYQSTDGRMRVFVGSGFDDEFRNFYSKFIRYSNALSSGSSDILKITEEFKAECLKKGIPFEKVINTRFNIVEKLNSVKLARNSIYDWASKQRIFVDADRILEMVVTKISLDLRENGGSLNKNEVLSIIDKCKQSKISSCNNGEELNDDKRYIIECIENQMRLKSMMFDKLQIIKHEIEMEMYIEAINHLEDVRDYCNLSTVHLWLQLMNGRYSNIIEKSNIEPFENMYESYILGEALLQNNDINEAIKIFEALRENGTALEVNYKLFECYKVKGDVENAEKELMECVNKGIENEFVYFELGKLHSRTPKCLEFYEKALDYNSKFFEVYSEKGKYLRYMGDFEEAIICFEKYLDLSKDYTNTEILLETAMSYYNANKDGQLLYLSRWVDCMMNFDLIQNLNTKRNVGVIDIGFEYMNFILVSKSDEGIEIKVNDDALIKLSNIRTQSGIGIMTSPVNYNFLKLVPDRNKDDKKIAEEATMPVLCKIAKDSDEYLVVKNEILSQKSLELNHDYEKYKEYIARDAKVSIFKKLDGLDAIVQIGDYTADILVPETDYGFQEFRKKMQKGSMFNEAAFMLFGPNETIQITIKLDDIEIFDI